MTSTMKRILGWLAFASAIAATQSGSAIDVAVDETKRESHVVDSLDLLLFVCLLILTIVTLWTFKHKRVRFLHESGLAVIYGLVIGLLLKNMGTSRTLSQIYVDPTFPHQLASAQNASGVMSPPEAVIVTLNNSKGEMKSYSYGFKSEYEGKEGSNPIKERATFNPEIFFYVLLPPIIFHAGYSMRKKHFFDNMGAIMAFALIGTLISTFVIGTIMYFVAALVPSLSLKFLDVLYFGAIVSATDPVTVLAIFQVKRPRIYFQGE